MQAKTNNRRKSSLRNVTDNVAPFALILGAIAGYFGFIFDINALFASGALVATGAICAYMAQPQTKGDQQ